MQTAATKPLPAIWRCEAAHAHASDCVPKHVQKKEERRHPLALSLLRPMSVLTGRYEGTNWDRVDLQYDLDGRACDIIARRDGADESTSSRGLDGRTV